MVALHGFAVGMTMTRTTQDVDMVADVLVRRAALQNCCRGSKAAEPLLCLVRAAPFNVSHSSRFQQTESPPMCPYQT